MTSSISLNAFELDPFHGRILEMPSHGLIAWKIYEKLSLRLTNVFLQ